MPLQQKCLSGNKQPAFIPNSTIMKILKLLVISILVFGMLFWGITLLFPSTTVISRATNIAGKASDLEMSMKNNTLSPHEWLLPEDHSQPFDCRTSDVPFYDADLFNAQQNAVANGDTLFLSIRQQDQKDVLGGVAFYQLSQDSATIQLYYVFENPWYKPWEKMRMMMMDKAIGPGMEAALQKLKQRTR